MSIDIDVRIDFQRTRPTGKLNPEATRMLLPAMFHWSPTERREQILLHGLMPRQINVVASSPMDHVCLAPTPSGAWALSGGTGWSEIEDWDLWQVRLQDGDCIQIRPEFDNIIREVNVSNPISPDRIWYVGSRTV